MRCTSPITTSNPGIDPVPTVAEATGALLGMSILVETRQNMCWMVLTAHYGCCTCFHRKHRGKPFTSAENFLSTYIHQLEAHTPKMDPETKPDAQPVDEQAQQKRERPASPVAAEPNEEDAMNDSNPTKKPKFEKKSKKDYKPKSPYPGRGKNYADRPQLSEEERKAKAEERERLRVERRIADEERLENREEGDRRLPKRRCALLMGWVVSHTP